nr:hypothetical protein Iba_chr13eCG2060 [Ipomoea batatas]
MEKVERCATPSFLQSPPPRHCRLQSYPDPEASKSPLWRPPQHCSPLKVYCTRGKRATSTPLTDDDEVVYEMYGEGSSSSSRKSVPLACALEAPNGKATIRLNGVARASLVLTPPRCIGIMIVPSARRENSCDLSFASFQHWRDHDTAS